MYQANFQPVSNRADWIGTFEMVNDETGETITDLTDVSMVLEVRTAHDCRAALSATTENGKVIDVGQGVFQWHFPRSEMACICPGSYEIGVTISHADFTIQMVVGILPIVDGVVSR